MSVRAQADGSRTRSARRRPAARRNPDASGAGRIQWDKVGRIAFVVLFFVLLFSYASPLINLAKTYRQAGATKVELHRVQAENALLERRVKHVQGDAVLRREARSQGMIVPGETPYVVNGIKP